MPALNFHMQFKPLLEARLKTQSYRHERKHPIKVGDTLYLYVGMRTKACEKVDTARAIETMPAIVTPEHIQLFLPRAAGVLESYYLLHSRRELDAEARADGFSDWDAMRRWFCPKGCEVWVGNRHRWDYPEVTK